MPVDNELSKALDLCGLSLGSGQESRHISLLASILKMQTNPARALEFGEIYEQVMKDDPSSGFTKAWVHRLLKKLVDLQLIRLESPDSRRKRYIADANTVMTGLERAKSKKIDTIEQGIGSLRKEAEQVSAADCRELAQRFVESIMGTEQKISSRIVRGKDELHRVLRYNMLDVAKEGDIIRATILWIGPFIDDAVRDRTARFVSAARRGAEVRYLVTTDVFRMDDALGSKTNVDGLIELASQIVELRQRGVKFDVRMLSGEKTYNQVSFNRESIVLIIAESPLTATWMVREFNPDLIDNAVAGFDRMWESAKSFLDLTLDDLKAFGVAHGGPISRIVIGKGGRSIFGVGDEGTGSG